MNLRLRNVISSKLDELSIKPCLNIQHVVCDKRSIILIASSETHNDLGRVNVHELWLSRRLLRWLRRQNSNLRAHLRPTKHISNSIRKSISASFNSVNVNCSIQPRINHLQLALCTIIDPQLVVCQSGA